ncbi:MAG: hypothetical protein AAFX50_22540, partial [Acidobacteriota bacterium]
LVEVPGLHGWRWGGGLGALEHSAGLFVRENLSLLAIAALAALLAAAAARREPRGGWRDLAQRRAWPLLLWIAACQFPLALVGRAKVGGDANAFSHSLYFLLLGVALLLRDLAFRGDGAAGGVATPPPPHIRTAARHLVLTAPLVMLVSVALFQERATLRTLSGDLHASHPYSVAARFAEANPGTVYFPRMNLVPGLVEGRIDHQMGGLIDLVSAGQPSTLDQVAGRLPPDLQHIAIYINGMADQMATLGPYFELERLPEQPDLPGFWLFQARLRDAPPPAAGAAYPTVDYPPAAMPLSR